MLQCALVELFKTWGVYPDCVVGHSSGEVAAAYAAGALSLAEATRLVYHRATLQQRTAGSGRMLPIGLDLAGVERLLDELQVRFRPEDGVAPPVEIACENAPASTVICGRKEALQPVMEELERRSLQHRLLPGNIAFHSAAMDQLEDDAHDALSFLNDIAFDAAVPFVSSVTGEHTDRLDNAYWWTNIRRRVRFAAALETAVRDFRPDVVLELAPHSALQPSIVQCLESTASRAVCIPTLRRDTDACLGFHEALGALFRAGVELDFAAQYPRPEPVAHLLPGYPRDEQTAADQMSDDEMFLQAGEYAHGPLIGHRVPCDHLLFEGRLSVRDFPWLAEHRVHHASIMPAAGYIELLLQAFEGVPLYVETLEFLQPCPIPTTPVRLQTELFPVPTAPGQYTFTISSRGYEVDAKSELHSRGTLRLVSSDHPVTGPQRLADIDSSRFEPYYYVGETDFYERLEASLGETFQYGTHFRNIQRVLWEDSTANYLFDVEMDEQLWTDGREEGYVVNPALLDGSLQIFLYHLLHATDIFSMPRRAVGLTFLRPPTVPRLTCYVEKEPDWAAINEMGQYTERRGDRSGGSIRVYDGATGELVLCIDAYLSFNSNPSWNDRPHSKHAISWQPKFVPDARFLQPRLAEGNEDELEPAALIAALEQPVAGAGQRYACRVIEIAAARPPEHTAVTRCFDYLGSLGAQTEYWLLGASDEQVRAYYDAFHNRDAALRFAALDLNAEQTHEWNTGFLRPQVAEILLLHDEAATYGPEQWRLLRRLAVPGGLALVCHDRGAPAAGAATDPAADGESEPNSGWDGAGWITLRSGHRATLLQAPQVVHEVAEPPQLAAPRWVVGEPGSLADAWLARLEEARSPAAAIPYAELADDRVADLADWPHAADLQAIDFLCGEDPDDPTGAKLAWRLAAFVRALIPFRVAQAQAQCRLTLVTRRAVFEVTEPRAGAAWGALRAITEEIAADAGTAARIDFRLVDLDVEEDLETLARLDGCDLRERELAIRGNRIWVPRLVSLRQRVPRVPADEDAAWRLSLDNPGQIGGLTMKSCEPGPLGADEVEIEVAAAALNFRDVMVTLGLLPSSSFERSALGRTVGLEASGVVRRAGESVRTCRVGDAVVFTQGGCIANRAVVKDYLVFRKPEVLSMEQAAAVLSVYVTAYYSLIHLARLRKGQRVLIHSAMGGVGQAAIALARHAGAEIYATAGSDAKREQLRALGVQAAFDSHSLDWYDELLAATGGEGVDVVLNSLAGRHIALCLEALRPGGWHCEIGKVDIYADNALSLSVFRKNLRFAAIDVDRLMNDDPYLTRELSQECLDLLRQGAVPPLPITTFPYRDYEEPLRLMTTGRHTGKLVLQAPAAAGEQPPVADLRPFLDPAATYLVTGAFGGFGRLLLPYLATVGARHITLLDRDPQRRRSADWLRRTSALWYLPEDIEIDVVAGDVACEADVRRCIAGLQRPLKGVFHLAGTLDDCLLADLTSESMATVFAPKARGALNLHRATAGCDLDHFVLFSSIASTLGNPGQVNYSAANGFLDGLAALRRQQGLPALSYNLAAVAEAGMAARNLHVLRMSRAGGVPPVSADFAITNLDYAMRAMRDGDHLVTALFSRPPWTVDSPDYLRTGRVLSNQDAFAVDTGGQLTQEAVVAQIAAKVAELCGHDEGSPEEPLSSFGLTSISVAELGAFIRMQFNHQVSALELMTTATCLSLSAAIMTGDQGGDAETDDGEAAGAEHEVAEPPPARRVPSAFASAPADHFPNAAALTLTVSIP
ncbi:MAG: KR domain-containing protein, partial [Spirochaetaceae bacterium]|nr:KR domain-containing protein [Spirochaetaceae bacterium]